MASKYKVGQTFCVYEGEGEYRYFVIKEVVRGAHGNNSHVRVAEYMRKTEAPDLDFDIPQYLVIINGEERWYFTSTISKFIKAYEKRLRDRKEVLCLAGSQTDC